jgi:hypothetical protein
LARPKIYPPQVTIWLSATIMEPRNAQMIEPLWTVGNGWSPNPLVLAGDWNGFNITNVTSHWKFTQISSPAAPGSPD